MVARNPYDARAGNVGEQTAQQRVNARYREQQSIAASRLAAKQANIAPGSRGGGQSSPSGMMNLRSGTTSITSPRTATTYNSPSAGVMSGLESLVSGYNQAYGEAKAANEARYQQMLGIADQTTGQRQADITSAYGQKSSDIMQRLAKLGMANTTVAPTMQMGVDREREEALSRSADQMQQTKLGIIDRRTDEYPDLAGVQSILAGVGSQYGGGQGLSAMLKSLGSLAR